MPRHLFISDLHLDEARPAIVARFERFLAAEASRADSLHILGDLFDAWVGDDSLSLPFPARIAAALSQASRRVPIAFLRGNRDFLAGEAFARATGVSILEEPVRLPLHGVTTVLCHGDTLCTDDLDYQRFRAMVRDPSWQRDLLAKPLAERQALARTLRAESDSAKEGKPREIMDTAPRAVDALFIETGADLMIHGHTHRPARHLHRVGGRDRVRWVLGEWYEGGSYLEVTPEGVRSVALD